MKQKTIAMLWNYERSNINETKRKYSKKEYNKKGDTGEKYGQVWL